MLFSSVSFLLGFFPVLLILYFLIPAKYRRTRNGILLIFSLFFYGCGGPKYLLLMLVSIAVNYLSGLLVDGSKTKKGKKLFLFVSVAINLGLLFYFKYTGFFTQVLNGFIPSVKILSITLPIGISFFTFQGMSYVIDVYRGDVPVQKNPARIALYISLFPQLIAGPIVRYSTVADEIAVRHENITEFADGLQRFMFGFAKKMIIANTAGEIADAIFAVELQNLTTATAWVGALAYTAQIYFDFSAYSDMAIGIGEIFGFHFLENFNYPYISKSVTEFWRRWHISLSTWFRDYVYIPLGGNRCSKSRNIFNLFVVWALTGMWHGASWNFIMWGLWFWVFLIFEKYILRDGIKKIPAFFGHVYTLLVVIVGWVLFRSVDLTTALGYTKAMFGFGAGLKDGQSIYYIIEYWPEWLLFIACSLPIYPKLKEKITKGKTDGKAATVFGIVSKLFAIFVFFIGYLKLVTGSFNPFIYFRF